MRRVTLDALGLSQKEHAVLNVLQHLPLAQKISKIAFQAELPHSTTSFILKKLEKRKLATRIKSNNHFRWKYRKNLEIFERIDDGAKKDTFLNVTSGMANIIHEFMRILELSSGERLYSIQGSAISKIILKKIDSKFLHFFHQAVKKKKIIIEGVMAQSILNLFGKMTSVQIESHLNRLTIAYVLPDELIQFPLDIFIFRDSVLLADYEAERLLHVEDSSLVLAFKSLFNIAKEYGRKVDLNKYLKELLKT